MNKGMHSQCAHVLSGHGQLCLQRALKPSRVGVRMFDMLNLQDRRLCCCRVFHQRAPSDTPSADTDLESRDCLYMGTVDYSSVRSLQGYHPSAWDDLEGLAVTLLEMATGGANDLAAWQRA